MDRENGAWSFKVPRAGEVVVIARDFREAGADHVLRSAAELPGWIDRLA